MNISSPIVDYLASFAPDFLPVGDSMMVSVDEVAVRVARFAHFDDPCYYPHL